MIVLKIESTILKYHFKKYLGQKQNGEKLGKSTESYSVPEEWYNRISFIDFTCKRLADNFNIPSNQFFFFFIAYKRQSTRIPI